MIGIKYWTKKNMKISNIGMKTYIFHENQSINQSSIVVFGIESLYIFHGEPLKTLQ